MSDSKFIHLHTHSHYSLLDGLSKTDEIVKIAKKNGMNAIALTDHGNMYGAIKFYKECKKNGIKPIIGCEVYMAERTRFDKEPGIDNKRYHLTLLAKNLTGYKNLIKIVSSANLEGYYYKPRADMDLLKEFSDGIICLSGCPGSKVSRAIRAKNFEKAEELIKDHQEIFGKENYFLEVQSHPKIEFDKELRMEIIKLGEKFDIKVVATQDSHYPCKEDHHAHHTLLQINTGSDGTEKGKFEFSDDDFSLIDEATAREYFKDAPGTVENSRFVADLCEDYEIELGVAHFPEFKIEDGKSPDEKLKELAYLGFEWRNIEKKQNYTERLEYELSIIKKKGYAEYFLVVGDMIRYARENKILSNIRGSVAGSLTTYLLGITKIDPLVYKLPFERFLNPERPSLPDIDMDYADDRRSEIITYTKQKYGEDRVAQIGTFGTMMAKGSVRDVARALGYPYSIGDRIANMIPLGSQGFAMTIDRAIEMIPELKDAYKNEKETKEIIDLAKKMEGCVRHVSVHAAGVVIAPKPLIEFVPIQYDPKGDKSITITQYDMHDVEDVGLPKFDFLGIKNLAILSLAVELVKQIYDIDIDIDDIPLDDKKTFEMLANGDTSGLFQLNGSGMTQYLKQLKPTTIHDINAMVALYRPGPIESIPEYIKRKHNNGLVKYLDPRMKNILDQSYGVITYQDDVMMIAIELGGYSWLEADKLRKAMGKKIPKEMEDQKEKLIDGFIQKGMDKKKAKELWELIEPFAAYGFNKAHAASYGFVAYQTAYMKANYPVEYMCAILTSESGDVDKVSEIVNECINMNITILPPSINESFGGFTVIKNSNDADGGTIRFGFYTIKNLGRDIADAIIEERKVHGKFKSLADFFERITHKNLNKKSVEALTKSGAMDELEKRGMILGNLEKLLEFNKEFKTINTQESLFGAIGGIETTLSLMDFDDSSMSSKLSWEKELLGLYVSGHPLDPFKARIEKMGTEIKKIQEVIRPGTQIIMASIITNVKIVNTKNNTRMAFLKISDYTGTIEAVVFPKTFEEHKDLLVADEIIAFEGKVTFRNEEKSIAIEKLKKLV